MPIRTGMAQGVIDALTSMGLSTGLTGSASSLVWHAAYPDSSGVMQAQLKGEGTPTFTNSALLLPDHEGVYVSIPANSPTWHGARWDGGVAYGTDGSGDPLTVQPSLYAAPAMTNSVTHSGDLSNVKWVAQTGTTKTDDYGVAPDGTETSSFIEADTNVGNNFFWQYADNNNAEVCGRIWVKGAIGEKIYFSQNTSVATSSEINLITFTGDWQEELSYMADVGTGSKYFSLERYGRDGLSHLPAVDFEIWNPELHLNKTIAEVRGSAPIVTAASTVTASAVSIAYDIANHSNVQGAYYIEWQTPSSIASDINGILTATNLSNSRPLRLQSTVVQNSYIAGFCTVSNTSGVGVVNKSAAIYDQNTGEVIAVQNGVDGDKLTNYDAYGLGANIELLRAAAQPTLIRNIRRYDATYTKAKAKIDELMV